MILDCKIYLSEEKQYYCPEHVEFRMSFNDNDIPIGWIHKDYLKDYPIIDGVDVCNKMLRDSYVVITEYLKFKKQQNNLTI